MTENEIINKHKKIFSAAATLLWVFYPELQGKHKKELVNPEVIVALTGEPPKFSITMYEFWEQQGLYINILKVCVLNLGSLIESFFKEYLSFKFPNYKFKKGFFQRLHEFDQDLGTIFFLDPRFKMLKDFMQIRHIYQHADGTVDKEFISKFERSSAYREGDPYMLAEKEVTEDYNNFRAFLNSLIVQ